MEIQELWRVICQRWRIVAIVTLVCTSLALGWSLAGPVSYKAQSKVIISTSGSLGTATDAQSGEQVSVERAPTYAQLLQGPEVAARASKILMDDTRPNYSGFDRRANFFPTPHGDRDREVAARERRGSDRLAAEQGLQQYVSEI